jgi:Bacterial nucleoid DNA-binding protein
VNKNDLISKVADSSRLSYADANNAVNAVIETIYWRYEIWG